MLLLLFLLGALPLPAAAEPRILHLEVMINGQPAGYILRVTQMPGGGLTADADELRNVGIQAGPGAGEVDLAGLPGVQAQVDEATQTLSIAAASEGRAPRTIAATAPDPREESQGGYGAVLNYGLWLEQGNAAADQVHAGDFGLRLFVPLGTLNHGWQVTGGQGAPTVHSRLDS